MSAEELIRWRSQLGRSAALWAGRDGVRVEPDRWLALSGAAAVDYNVAVCHGAGSVAPGRDELLAGGAPGLVMLAGAALEEAGVLRDAGWVCLDWISFMRIGVGPGASPLGLAGTAPAAELRRLAAGEVGAARALLASVFGTPLEFAAVALPDAAPADPAMAIWGAFDEGGTLVSTLASARVDDAVGLWSAATTPAARGRGLASHLLGAALADLGGDGARIALLHAAPAATDYYLHLGFHEIERWQLWSRPRWVLGRA